MIETYKNINISVGYQCFWTKPSEQGCFSQMSPNSGMLETQKHKYLQQDINVSAWNLQTGLIFPSQSKWVQIVYNWNESNISAWNLQNRAIFLSQLKWVQIVVCYDQNLQKHKYLSRISMFLHETFRTGLIFPSRSKMSPNSGMLRLKLTKT